MWKTYSLIAGGCAVGASICAKVSIQQGLEIINSSQSEQSTIIKLCILLFESLVLYFPFMKNHAAAFIGALNVGGSVLFNALMWFYFTRAMSAAPSTMHATGLITATNILLTGASGYLLFDENVNLTWICGAVCLIIGTYFIQSEAKQKEQ